MTIMHVPFLDLAATVACGVLAIGAGAQSAKEVRGPSPLVAIANEASGQADRRSAAVLNRSRSEPGLPIQYRTENSAGGAGVRRGRARGVAAHRAHPRHRRRCRRGTSSMPAARR